MHLMNLPKLKPNWLSTALLMSPLKRKSGSDVDTPDSDGKRAKPQMPLIDPDAQDAAQSEAQKLLIDPQRNWILAPREPPTTMSTNGWPVTKPSQSLKANIRSLSSMYRLFRNSSKQESPKTNWFRQQSISDWMPNLASRLSVKNLSTAIAVAQFKAA